MEKKEIIKLLEDRYESLFDKPNMHPEVRRSLPYANKLKKLST